MLRQIYEERFPGQGKEMLLTAMRKYVTDPSLRWNPVGSDDFRAHAEAVYGSTLDWFFDPWLLRIGFPHVRFDWKQQGERLTLNLNQDPDDFYRLPIQVRVTLIDGSIHEQVVWMDGPRESHQFDFDALVAQVVLDPERDLMIDVSGGSQQMFIHAAYPNPFSPTIAGAMTVELVAAGSGPIEVHIYDTRGRRVRTLYNNEAPGGVVPNLIWNGLDDRGNPMASGVYYLSAIQDGERSTQKIALLR